MSLAASPIRQSFSTGIHNQKEKQVENINKLKRFLWLVINSRKLLKMYSLFRLKFKCLEREAEQLKCEGLNLGAYMEGLLCPSNAIFQI